MGALVALTALGGALSLAPLQTVDARISGSLDVLRDPAVTAAASWITRLGDLWLVTLLIVVTLVALRWAPHTRRLQLVVLATFVGSQLMVGVLKLAVARPRPAGALEATFSSAYPSGHAVRAVAVYGLAAWACHRWCRGAARWLGVAATGALALAIALSRLALGVHRPSEVAVSILLGGAWLAIVVSTCFPPPASNREHEEP